MQYVGITVRVSSLIRLCSQCLEVLGEKKTLEKRGTVVVLGFYWKKTQNMVMKDLHSECPQCKMWGQFYEKFSDNSKQNMPHFGLISYVKNKVKSDSSDETTEAVLKNDQNYTRSNVSFHQLKNEWMARDLVARRSKQKNRLMPYYLEEENNKLFSSILQERKRNSGPKPPYYQPEHAGNLIIVKKPDFSSKSSADDRVARTVGK